MIPAGRDKLIKHIAGMRMDFHSVKARPFGRGGHLAEGCDQFVDLLDRHGGGVLVGLEIKRQLTCG